MLDPIIATWSRPDIVLVTLFALSTTLLWRVPLIGMLFYPFRLLNTFIHELGHGFAALLTGGSFERFIVRPDMSGLALIRGGNLLVVASAGYVGAALFGGFLILLSATDLATQTILLGLGLGLGLLCLLFVRNGFGVLAGLLLAASLGAAGWYFNDGVATLLVAVLALQMPLAAMHSLIDLLRRSVRRPQDGQVSDAELLAERTRVPALIWATLWLFSALAIMVLTVTFAYHDTVLLPRIASFGW
ncbi:MAG: M50 family metallopeptidase [Oscillochloridaceae bacterium umkhey_bin13]